MDDFVLTDSDRLTFLKAFLESRLHQGYSWKRELKHWEADCREHKEVLSFEDWQANCFIPF